MTHRRSGAFLLDSSGLQVKDELNCTFIALGSFYLFEFSQRVKDPKVIYYGYMCNCWLYWIFGFNACLNWLMGFFGSLVCYRGIVIFLVYVTSLKWLVQSIEHELDGTTRLHELCSEYERQMEE